LQSLVSKEARADQAGGNFAFQRLRQPLFQPAITPQFKMKREDKLFDSSFHRFSDLE
jgi:hypothetical protein